MRKVIVSNLVSLDGFFEGPNKELDWFVVEEEFFDFARTNLEFSGWLIIALVNKHVIQALNNRSACVQACLNEFEIPGQQTCKQF